MIAPNDNNPQRKKAPEEMPVRQTDVHADKAVWSCVRDAKGNLVECTGVFHRVGPRGAMTQAECEEYAFGLQRHLRHERIIQLEEDQQLVVREPNEGGCRITLREVYAYNRPGDKMEKFEREIARPHHLFSDERTKTLPLYHTLIFPPAAAYHGRRAVHNLTWTPVEINAGQYHAMRAETEDVKVAFDAALYLKGHGCMEESQFWRLNDEIRAGISGTYSIVVPPQHEVKFLQMLEDIRHEMGPPQVETAQDFVKRYAAKPPAPNAPRARKPRDDDGGERLF